MRGKKCGGRVWASPVFLPGSRTPAPVTGGTHGIHDPHPASCVSEPILTRTTPSWAESVPHAGGSGGSSWPDRRNTRRCEASASLRLPPSSHSSPCRPPWRMASCTDGAGAGVCRATVRATAASRLRRRDRAARHPPAVAGGDLSGGCRRVARRSVCLRLQLPIRHLTTTLSNGRHTIAWLVRDSAGRAEGIGSRFFHVYNP